MHPMPWEWYLHSRQEWRESIFCASLGSCPLVLSPHASKLSHIQPVFVYKGDCSLFLSKFEFISKQKVEK